MTDTHLKPAPSAIHISPPEDRESYWQPVPANGHIDVALAPHCPLGPVALAACLQVDFVSWNAMLQEQSIGIHYNEGADLLPAARGNLARVRFEPLP